MKRICGECEVCCFVAGVPDLDKEPYSKCEHQCNGCAIIHEPSRPKVCGSFECSWLRGHGEHKDRPDNIGAMFAINKTPSGDIHFAIETEENAIFTTARSMAIYCASNFPFPLIVSKHGSVPPDDRGDYIVIRDEMKNNWARNIGDLIENLSETVSIYRLKF